MSPLPKVHHVKPVIGEDPHHEHVVGDKAVFALGRAVKLRMEIAIKVRGSLPCLFLCLIQSRTYDTALKHLVRLQLENSIAREQMEVLRQFNEDRAAKQAFSAYLRFLCTCTAIICRGHELRKLFFDAREELVDLIQRVRPSWHHKGDKYTRHIENDLPELAAGD